MVLGIKSDKIKIYFISNGTFTSWDLKENAEKNVHFSPNKWSHVCISVDVTMETLKMVWVQLNNKAID
jgi:hypothetical protein